jgi:acetyl-CoA carboxylase carboxyl transferase subunit alpha
MAYDLEFEKPLAELEKKINALQKKGDRLKADEHRQLQDLEQELHHRTEEIYRDLSSWQTVQVARHKERPHALDYLNEICDDFFELCGDRAFSDDHSILGGLAQLDGETLMLVCHQKGRTMKDKQHYNNGMPHPEGFRKAGRLMLQVWKTKSAANPRPLPPASI